MPAAPRGGGFVGASAMRQMLEKAIKRLRRRGCYDAFAESLTSHLDDLAALRKMTLFAPKYLSALFLPPAHLLPLLVVPDRRLTHADLRLLPPLTALPTLDPRRRLAIAGRGTAILAGNSSLAIWEPDLAVSARIAVHGVERPGLAALSVPPLLSPSPTWGAADGGGMCGRAALRRIGTALADHLKGNSTP